MTPEEIVAQVEAKNIQLLISSDFEFVPGLIDLLNQAAMNGVQIGSQMASSMITGAMLVQLAKARGEREPCKQEQSNQPSPRASFWSRLWRS